MGSGLVKRCFIRFSLLTQDMKPLLIDSFHFGNKDWTIFELVRIISQRSGEETEIESFSQQPNSLRRKKISNAGLYSPNISSNVLPGQ